MKIAYADPPYIGQARRRYACPEVDHTALIKRLCAEFDAWALSCSSPSLFTLLPLCPSGTRIAAWVKPFAIFKPGVNPAYAWEPVLFYGVRKRPRTVATVRDWISSSITLKRGLCGAKPTGFCDWLFDLLALELSDTFADLFIGTGAVTKAYEAWRERKLAVASATAPNKCSMPHLGAVAQP